MRGSRIGRRLALVGVLCLAYIVLIFPLIASSRRESALVSQVAQSEKAVAQARSSRFTEIQSLRTDLAAQGNRQAALTSRFPAVVTTDIFNRVVSRAQQSGIIDFGYESKGDYVEKLQTGLYRVYRYSIQGRATPDKLLSFLDSLQKDAVATILVDNVTMTAIGKDWQMAATMLVYTLGS